MSTTPRTLLMQKPTSGASPYLQVQGGRTRRAVSSSSVVSSASSASSRSSNNASLVSNTTSKSLADLSSLGQVPGSARSILPPRSQSDGRTRTLNSASDLHEFTLTSSSSAKRLLSLLRSTTAERAQAVKVPPTLLKRPIRLSIPSSSSSSQKLDSAWKSRSSASSSSSSDVKMWLDNAEFSTPPTGSALSSAPSSPCTTPGSLNGSFVLELDSAGFMQLPVPPRPPYVSATARSYSHSKVQEAMSIPRPTIPRVTSTESSPSVIPSHVLG